MPKVAYSEEDRERIRAALVTEALERMARQGIQHTTVEQIYKAVGISRTFFYSFFPTKEDLIVETLTNLSLTAMIVRRAIPESLPLFVPEAADATVAFQIDAIVDRLERLKEQGS